jgi:hypothetical protein
MTSYNKVLLFNLAQFSLITHILEQLILEKCTSYMHWEHCMPKNKTCINFQRMIFLSDKELSQFYIQKQTKVNSVASTMHIGKTLISATVSMKLYYRHTLNSVINTTYTSCWCGLTDTWNIQYNSDFEMSGLHMFWQKLWRLVSTLSATVLLEIW